MLISGDNIIKIPFIASKQQKLPIVTYFASRYITRENETKSVENDIRMFGMLLAKVRSQKGQFKFDFLFDLTSASSKQLLQFGKDASDLSLISVVDHSFKIPACGVDEYVKTMELCMQFNPPVNFTVIHTILALISNHYPVESSHEK